MDTTAQRARRWLYPELKTERLDLRRPQPGDEDFLISLETNPEVRRYIYDGPLSADEAEREAKTQIEWAKHRPTSGRWIVQIRERNVDVGWVQAVKYRGPCVDETLNDYLQVDYEFLPEYWGQGYAREAVEAVLDYVFERLQMRLALIYTRPENERSVRLVSRLGFTQIGNCRDESGRRCNLYKKDRSPRARTRPMGSQSSRE